MVDEMESAALKIADINQQLLALGRRGHYSMEDVHVNELIINLIASQPQFRHKSIHQDLDQELLPIKGGAAQLTRALTNILLNAVEAVQDGGIITVRTRNTYLEHPLDGYETIRRGEYVLIEIVDTGVGIKSDHMDKIFDPFFTTKRMDRMRGSGLGLSVVHGIVNDHHGYVCVDSKPNEGAKFAIYIPISRSKNVPVKEIFEDIRGGKESILIVDDDPMQRKVTSNLLNRLGYKVHSVNSGEEALDYVRKTPQDLLILDMVMDGIDGTETYERIIKMQPGQKAIMLSGYAKSKRVEKALKLGAGGFVPKPVSLKSLALAVRKELDGQR
jgi:CheY-like chemotaxis protein